MIAANTRNRVAAHLTAVERTAPIVVPATPAGRQAAYAEAVMTAILVLQKQLTHPDVEVSQAAAVAIVDLEKTRMRHDTPVAGTHAPSEILEPLGELPPLERPRAGSKRPLAERAEHAADTWEEFVDHVWDEMQADADEERSGEIISLEQAEEYARVIHARMQKQGVAPPHLNPPAPSPQHSGRR